MRRDCGPSWREFWIARSRLNSSNSTGHAGAAHFAAGGAEFAQPDHARRPRCRACPTFIRARSSGICRWSIPTTGGRWILRSAPPCWHRWKRRIGRDLAQNWPNGHIKLAWTRHLLKLRTELAGVFAHGDYQPLEVSGPHRDHVIAFARRRGRDAAIVAVTKSFAAFSQGGRAWPDAETFDGALRLDGYSVEGSSGARAAALQPFPTSAGGGAARPGVEGA